jgi:predicted cupin superfamily sugar epimerase
LTPDAARIAELLELAPHPEGGFYRETARGAPRFEALARDAYTAIYFLLPAGTFSALHRVRSDEVWHHYDGDPVALHLVTDGGTHRELVLGKDVASGERPQIVVPAGVWQAAVPRGDRYALCGCTVSPGFDFADFEMPSRAELLARFPQHDALVQKLTR